MCRTSPSCHALAAASPPASSESAPSTCAAAWPLRPESDGSFPPVGTCLSSRASCAANLLQDSLTAQAGLADPLTHGKQCAGARRTLG